MEPQRIPILVWLRLLVPPLRRRLIVGFLGFYTGSKTRRAGLLTSLHIGGQTDQPVATSHSRSLARHPATIPAPAPAPHLIAATHICSRVNQSLLRFKMVNKYCFKHKNIRLDGLQLRFIRYDFISL